MTHLAGAKTTELLPDLHSASPPPQVAGTVCFPCKEQEPQPPQEPQPEPQPCSLEVMRLHEPRL